MLDRNAVAPISPMLPLRPRWEAQPATTLSGFTTLVNTDVPR